MPEDFWQSDGSLNNLSSLKDYLTSHKILLALILAGLGCLILGLVILLGVKDRGDQIEIIPAVQNQPLDKVQADIEGAIVRPGVYELSFGSRVNDLLIMAGGLAAEADREWVQTNLNKAQKLKDGDKFYIPLEGKSAGIISGSSTTTVSSKININAATLAELDALWGVGPVMAQKIIDNRPYQKTEDLLTRKILSKTTYQKIKEQLMVY